MSVDAAAKERMKGKELEAIVLERLRKEQEDGLCHFTRYGVQTSIVSGEAGESTGHQPSGFSRGQGHLIAQQSKPDLEGVVRSLGGRHVVFDCKVESGSSFSLSNYRRTHGQNKAGSREKQLTHMLCRAAMGGICFFLIRWSRRQLVKAEHPLEHFAFPVHPDMSFWQEFDAGDRASITREDCRELGYVVEWNLHGSGRKPRPDVLAAIVALSNDRIFSV